MTLSYLYILTAAVFQLGWLYNMKRIKKGMFKEGFAAPLNLPRIIKAILPIVLYIIFGVANVIFLTWAMNNLLPSTTYAIWTGIVIASAAIIDQVILKQKMTWNKIIFVTLILAGIVGLRLTD